jgi:hypothetical protein
MLSKEKIGNKLYIWFWERGLNKDFVMVMDRQPFTAKDTKSFNQSIKK